MPWSSYLLLQGSKLRPTESSDLLHISWFVAALKIEPRALSGTPFVFTCIFIHSGTALCSSRWVPVCKSWFSGDFMGLSRPEVHTSWQRTPSTNRSGTDYFGWTISQPMKPCFFFLFV